MITIVYSYYRFHVQTLTSLELQRSLVGVIGAYHLAEALKVNQVRLSDTFETKSLYCRICFTDTYFTVSIARFHVWQRIRTSE
jgi:hypothetical protein